MYDTWLEKEKDFYRACKIIFAFILLFLFMGATAISKSDVVYKNTDLILIVEVKSKATKSGFEPDIPESIFDLCLESNIVYDNIKKSKTCWISFRVPKKYETDFLEAIKKVDGAKVKINQAVPTPTVTRTP